MKYFFGLLICLFLISSCKKKETTPDITSGLVANIPLDGNALETVTNTTGEIHFATPAANRFNETNKAMRFNRADSALIDFGDLVNTSFPNNKFTISVWVYVTDTSHPLAVLSKRGPFGPFEYSIDNHFDRAVFDFDNWIDGGGTTVYGIDPLNTNAPVYLNSWHHIAYVADGTVLKVYVDGILQTGTDARINDHVFTHTSAHFIVGNGGAYNAFHYFNGSIDDIRIYNKALSAETVKYLSEI